MRDVKSIVRRKNVNFIDAAGQVARDLPDQRGWIERFRIALGMSVTDLALRVGVTRPSISKLESREKEGSVSIGQLEKVAAAMGGKLVYAIIPAGKTVDEIVMSQARKKASKIVTRTRTHMALEAQSEGLQSKEDAIEELANELAREIRRDFWK